jgi:hypothetical protein
MNSASSIFVLGSLLASFCSSIIVPQLLKHLIILNVSLFNLFLSLLITKAPCEKNLSLESLVAGIAK